MNASLIVLHIFKGIIQIGLSLFAFYNYKKSKKKFYLLGGLAFLLQFYEILFLNRILPYFIYIIISVIQAVLFSVAIILLIMNYYKGYIKAQKR